MRSRGITYPAGGTTLAEGRLCGGTLSLSSSGFSSGWQGSLDNVDLGVGVANLWFDVETDNQQGIDNDATLESYWHYDHTTAPDAGKYSLYSITQHEILHAEGIGFSKTWDNQVSGSSNWAGSAAFAAHGA